MWRYGESAELLRIVESAREIAGGVVAPLVAAGARSSHEWSPGKARIVEALDRAGLTRLLFDLENGGTPTGIRHTAAALAVFELARVDAGAASCLLTGILALAPISRFGTAGQQQAYLSPGRLRHGALCVTEPLPFAGADVSVLSGTARVAKWDLGQQPVLQVSKRGRFISHMAFADTVIAAVSSGDDRIRGSCLVILEETDDGEFDRGLPVRKLAHQLSSTRNPSFLLQAPASRIVGGYSIENNVITPRFSHREILGPVLRAARATVSLMTAANLASAVEMLLAGWRATPRVRRECPEQLVEICATSEAACSLGFSAARLCDEIELLEHSFSPGLALRADALSAAAKLWNATRAASALRSALHLMSEAGLPPDAIVSVLNKCLDSAAEAIYLGPEATQRRILSSVMTSGVFLEEVGVWAAEMEDHCARPPDVGAGVLAAALRLWCWTLEYLRTHRDPQGGKWLSDARQSVAFAMADVLSWLLAVRAQILDVLELAQRGARRSTALPESSNRVELLACLCRVHAVRAAGETARVCSALLHGGSAAGQILDEFRKLRQQMERRYAGVKQTETRAGKLLLEL
jgi:alkylation response protein AidB-like acyl-CoA dehydrogenase